MLKPNQISILIDLVDEEAKRIEEARGHLSVDENVMNEAYLIAGYELRDVKTKLRLMKGDV